MSLAAQQAFSCFRCSAEFTCNTAKGPRSISKWLSRLTPERREIAMAGIQAVKQRSQPVEFVAVPSGEYGSIPAATGSRNPSDF